MLQISVSGPKARTSNLLLIVPTAEGTLGLFSSNVKWRLQNFSFRSTCLTPWVWVAFFAEPDYFKSPTTVSLCTYTNKNASPPCFAFCLRFAARTSAGGRRDGVWRPWLNHNQTMNTNPCTPHPSKLSCLPLSLFVLVHPDFFFLGSNCTAAVPLEIIYDTVTRGTL